MEQPELIPVSGLNPEVRARSITATDIGKILGIHPYGSAWDVYATKIGLVTKPPLVSEAAEIGTALQLAVKSVYEQRTGEPVEWWDETQVHPKFPWASATPDGRLKQIRIDGKRGIYEGKTAGNAQVYRWGPSWSDEFPEEYRAQMGWQCFVTGYDFCDLAVLLGAETLTIRTYRFEPTKEYLAMLEEAAHSFWFDHVLARVPPEIKPTSLADLYLKSVKNSADFREPTPEEMEWIKELRTIDDSEAPNKKRKEELEVKLKASIGTSDGLRWGKEKLSYKNAADSASVDWKAVATQLGGQCGDAALETAISANTTTKPGSRRFLVPWRKGDKKAA